MTVADYQLVDLDQSEQAPASDATIFLLRRSSYPRRGMQIPHSGSCPCWPEPRPWRKSLSGSSGTETQWNCLLCRPQSEQESWQKVSLWWCRHFPGALQGRPVAERSCHRMCWACFWPETRLLPAAERRPSRGDRTQPAALARRSPLSAVLDFSGSPPSSTPSSSSDDPHHPTEGGLGARLEQICWEDVPRKISSHCAGLG